MHFYQLTQKQEIIDNMLLDSQGELTNEILTAMDELDNNKQAVIFQLANIKEEFETRLAGITAKMEQLTAKKKACEGSIFGIKSTIVDIMKRLGMKSVTNGANKIVLITKANDSVDITDKSAVPDTFSTYTVKLSPEEYQFLKTLKIEIISEEKNVSKTDIKKEFKRTGEPIPGTSIKDTEYPMFY